MIILLVILSAAFFYLFGAVWVEHKSHLVWSILSLVVLIASVAAFALHDVNNLGMKTETTTKTVQHASNSKTANLLVYKQLGTGSEKVYVYKTTNNSKKHHTWVDKDAKVKVSTTTGAAKLVIKKQQYVYKNGFSKLMFGVLGDNKETKQISYNFKLNSTWVSLSTSQAKKLAAAMKNSTNQAQLQTAIASQVKAKLTAALTENPTMSAAEQAKLQTKYTNEAKAQAIRSLLNK